MKNKLVVLSVCLGAITSFADTIDGSYVIESVPGCTSQENEYSKPSSIHYEYNAVSIARDSLNKNIVTIKINRTNSMDERPEIATVICDSQEHSEFGDNIDDEGQTGVRKNKGDTYVAHCEENSIEIRYVYQQDFVSPITLKFKKTKDGLEMVRAFEGPVFVSKGSVIDQIKSIFTPADKSLQQITKCSFVPRNSRYFLCKAEDKIGRTSLLKVDVDAKTIQQKNTSHPTSNWTTLNDTTMVCGQKIQNTNCQMKNLSFHSNELRYVKDPHINPFGFTRCEYDELKSDVKFDTYVGINTTDGTGNFNCGGRSENDLTLTQCKSVKY